MSDLTARLRDYSPENRQHVVHEAADEIERLRGLLREALDVGGLANDLVRERIEVALSGADQQSSVQEGSK